MPNLLSPRVGTKPPKNNEVTGTLHIETFVIDLFCYQKLYLFCKGQSPVSSTIHTAIRHNKKNAQLNYVDISELGDAVVTPCESVACRKHPKSDRSA